jgi:hypothetical protein
MANAISLFGPQRPGDPEMIAQINTAEGLPLAELAPDWTEACLATSYCAAADLPDLPGDLATKICGNFPDDNLWGIAFLKGDRLVSIRDMSALGKFSGRSVCLSPEVKPRLTLNAQGRVTIGGQ